MKEAKMEKKASNKRVKREFEQDQYNQAICVIVEKAEAQLLTEEMQGKTVDKLYYSFNSKQKDDKGNFVKIEGLTFWGYKACAEQAKTNKWKPKFGKPDFHDHPNGKTTMTIAVTNPRSKETEYGVCTFDSNVRFNERTAATNCKKYGLDKMIPVAQRIAFIGFLKQYRPETQLALDDKGMKALKSKDFTTSSTPTPDDAKKDIAIKSIFAQIGALEQKHGVKLDKNKTKQYYKCKYGVVSLRDLNIDQMKEVWQDLYDTGRDREKTKKFAQLISTLEVKNDDAE